MKKFFEPVGKLGWPVFFAVVSFSGCEKSVAPSLAPEKDRIEILVRDTLFMKYTRGPEDTPYDQKAFLLTFSITHATWSPQEPVILEVFKYYPQDEVLNAVTRVFLGGGGVTEGDTVTYLDADRNIDTLRFADPVQAVVLKSDQDKRVFHFEVAARVALKKNGPRFFEGGFENNHSKTALQFGGGATRAIKINDHAPMTRNNVVRTSITFDTTGLDTFQYYKFSTIGAVLFKNLKAMDSVLKHPGAVDTASVRISRNLLISLLDSTITDTGLIPLGRFGGMQKIPVVQLQNHFSTVAPAEKSDLGSGWVTVEKIDTLPRGLGRKWVFLNHKSWTTPLFENIDIDNSFAAEIRLDLSRAKVRYNTFEKKVALDQDEIPFVFDTFGDTTFEQTVWVWLATRVLGQEFLTIQSDEEGGEQGVLIFGNRVINQTDNELDFKAPWPDALLETKPRLFRTGAGGVLRASFLPDYEGNYRVSPFAHIKHNFDLNSGTPLEYDQVKPERGDNPSLARVVKKGSLLGYDEKDLNNFAKQQYILSEQDGVIKRIALTGWFNFVPLSQIGNGDSTFSGENLVDYFGLRNFDDLLPLTKFGGNRFTSIFSAFFYRPQFLINNTLITTYPQVHDKATNAGVKLFRPPFRGIPYFVNSNQSGSKEFVLIAMTRGRFFKEPRVFISFFSSPLRYVWDKIPPHARWHAEIDPNLDAYAPVYAVNRFNPNLKVVSDLSATNNPNFFEVHLSDLPAASGKHSSVRDLGGFAQITSVKLGFNYAADLVDVDPVSGFRQYKGRTNYRELDPRALSKQRRIGYGSGESYALEKIAFKEIDATLWRSGVWDMWIETKDDMGNEGIAPFIIPPAYDLKVGQITLRQILIK